MPLSVLLIPALLLLVLSAGSALAQPSVEEAAAQSAVFDSGASPTAGAQLECSTGPFTKPQLRIGAHWGVGFTGRTASLFYSPTQIGKITWAVGPAVMLPTILGANGGNPWGAGASALASRTEGPWSYGAFISNVWSFGEGGGSGDRANALTLQPFITYKFDEGWYATSAPAITANWLAESEKWSLPLSASIGRQFSLGEVPVDVQLQGSFEPDLGGDNLAWQLRSQLTLAF